MLVDGWKTSFRRWGWLRCLWLYEETSAWNRSVRIHQNHNSKFTHSWDNMFTISMYFLFDSEERGWKANIFRGVQSRPLFLLINLFRKLNTPIFAPFTLQRRFVCMWKLLLDEVTECPPGRLECCWWVSVGVRDHMLSVNQSSQLKCKN